MRIISLDYETFYAKNYSIRGSIVESYCADARFNPYLISVCDGATCWAGSPKDFTWSTIDGQILLSHNARFDSGVFLEQQRRGWVPAGIKPAQWHCTADMTSFLCNRRALDNAVEHLLKIKLSKQARSDAKGKNWPQDFDPAEQKTMLDYARDDAFYCWTLFDKFGGQWPEVERRLSVMTREQGRRGVAINQELLDSYIMEVHYAKVKTEKLLPWLDTTWDEEDEFNTVPTSTKCIAEQCRRVSIPCPPVKKDDEEAFEEWETKFSAEQPWIPALSSWRTLNATYKRLMMVKDRLRADGTLPFALKYFGAHTGRWSGDAGINFQNFRKVPILLNEQGLMETNDRRVEAAANHHEDTGEWPTWVKFVIDFRALLVPRAGKKMIVSDLSQIEPRVLCYLAGDTATLDLLRGGMSIYEAHARATMGWKGGVLKDENKRLYALAKARVLGLGYGCGWEKFIAVARSMARLDITEGDPEWIEYEAADGTSKKQSGYGKFSREIVTAYRGANKKITDLWERLDGGLKASTGKDFIIRLPSGRSMRYERVSAQCRVEPDKETGKPRRKYVWTCDYDGKRRETYGGKLTENLVQAVSRDVFGEQLVQMEDHGLPALFSVHDEAVLEVDASVTAKDIEHEMSHCPDWLTGCPIGAEAEEVPCYIK